MMHNSSRRRFLLNSGIGAIGALMYNPLAARSLKKADPRLTFISTWNHGKVANEKAIELVQSGKEILEAVEKGVAIVESEEDGRSVGLGGFPDSDGTVSLDACIMKGNGASGSVGALQDIEHPISVARKVMEETPHVMLVGTGAKKFALSQGFPEKELLVPETIEAYEKWKKESDQKPPAVNNENHDTIGLLGLAANGEMAGACTTSGWAFKMPGRLGDSPIIGAGLFVDDEVGGATASGLGETIIQTAGCHTVVELMRQGYTPEEACKEACKRISKKHSKWKISDVQACFIALRKDGVTGSYCIKKGFNYALTTQEGTILKDAPYLLK